MSNNGMTLPLFIKCIAIWIPIAFVLDRIFKAKGWIK